MATAQNSEKQPLLRNENVSYNQGYNEYVEGGPSAPAYSDVGIQSASSILIPTPVPAIQPDELPPPYTSSASGTSAVVSCRVCGVTINISGKDDKHVVQCSNCNEATPIRVAPPGKKYVRCPCNCLLICKVSSKKISCPRQNCKRIICLSSSAVAVIQPSAGACQVSCPYCHSSFPVNLIVNNCVRCMFCRKQCALIPEYARKRALVNVISALCCLVSLIVIVATTHPFVKENPGLYFVYMLLAALFVAGLLRALYYFSLKSVIIESPT